jgi:hypothetical protein
MNAPILQSKQMDGIQQLSRLSPAKSWDGSVLLGINGKQPLLVELMDPAVLTVQIKELLLALTI